MKTKLPKTLFALWLALALANLPPLRAASFAEATELKQESPPTAPAAPTAPTEQPASADKSLDQNKSAQPGASPAAEMPVQTAATPETDKPAAERAVVEATTDDKSVTPESVDKAISEPEKPAAQEKKAKRVRTIGIGPQRKHGSDNERISFGQGSTLAAGEKAGAVVSILGSSTSAGEVSDAVVSVVGNTRVTGGTVGDAAVAVAGNVYVNGHVKGEVVAVLGNVEFGPDAVVDGEVVCIGGEVIRDPKAVVHGNVQHIAIGGRHFNFEGLQTWFTQCLLYARPLAFDAHLLWAWCIALAFLGFYALLALVAPAGVTKCVQTLEERPGKSILAAVLTLLLTPVAYLLLILTVAIAIGIVLLPIFSTGLFFASLFGKVVMLAWLGRRITKLFGDGPLAHPVFAVLIGGVIVLGLYTVPILGFIVYKLLGMLGLGVVIYTLLLSLKSSRAAAVAARPPVAAGVVAVAPVLGEDAGAGSAPMPTATQLPPVISAATLPRAGFWIRFLASVLDAALFVIICIFLSGLWRGFPLWFALYCTVMWATKGTTIGGIICGLKVVRIDDRPIDWGVAVVRALTGFLSFFLMGLGFIWVAFDEEKQSWHDKVAGTTIVKVPKGTPLL